MALTLKQFGNFSFKVCEKTSFICAKNILETYNKTAEKQKKMYKMSEYMKNPKFLKSVVADFDKTVKERKIDTDYLNHIINKVNHVNEDFDVDYSKISNTVKFDYMIRQTYTTRGNMKKIISLLVHPTTAIKISIWLSPKFGYSLIPEFKEKFSNILLYVESDNDTIDLSFPDKCKMNNNEEKI